MNDSRPPKSNYLRLSLLMTLALAGAMSLVGLNMNRSVVHAQSCLVTDTFPRTIPPPPALPQTGGGTFVDPTFCTTIMRVTVPSDGDCHTFYSYWPTFNLDNTMFIYAANNFPKLGHFDPIGFHLIDKVDLFSPGSLFLSAEDAIWSSSDPNVLYAHEGPRLWEYNVSSKMYTPLKDFTAQVPANGYVFQMSKSADDNVFAFTIKDANYQPTGYVVWRKSTNTILLTETVAELDEVQVDKTGRYLAVKANFMPGFDFKAIDLQVPNSGVPLSSHAPDYAPGHSDNGIETVIGYDDDNNRFTRRDFPTILDPNTTHVFSTIFNLNDWSQASHLSMLANNENWCVVSNYTNPGSDASGNAFRQEIFQVATDGSMRVRRLAHHHSVFYTPNDYYATPRANISRDGKFIAFTSNWGTGRQDVFFLKVPPLSDCSFTLNPPSRSFASAGGADSISVTPNDPNCSWTAVSNNPTWISITSGSSGMGTGTVNYSVSANTGPARNGSITVAGLVFNISQAGTASGVENVIWTHESNCTVNGNSVVKTGGGDGGCNGGAWSQQTITSGNGYLQFTASETNKLRYGALTSMTTTNDFLKLDFSIAFTSYPAAEVRENGQYKTDVLFASGDMFKIALESGVVKYYKNGVAFWTSTKTPTFPLYANALLCNLNSTINDAVITMPCTYTIVPAMQSFGSGSGTGSISVTPNDGNCFWTAVSNNPSWISITSGSTGTGTGTVNYSVGANTGVGRSGTITVASQTFSISQAGTDSGVQNVIWTHESNCTVNGNSVVKTGGGDGGCNGGAWSQQTITSGNGYLEFTASETNKLRYGALTSMTTTNDFLKLDFSIAFTSYPAAEVKENGQYKTDVVFASGDVFRIALESGVVKYYKNGVAFWTSTKTPTFPLYANALLCNLNSTITNAVMLAPSCATVAPASQSFPASVGTGAISVNAPTGCSWWAVNNNTWITITSGSSGSGDGTVTYSVAANPNSTIRSGIISVNSQIFTVYQGIDFPDVPSSNPFYNDIGKLSARSVTLGCGGGNFCPNDSVTRQSMAAFLLRSLGEFSPPTPASQRFSDVLPSNVFYNFIDRLAVLNITQGCGGGNFCPADPVTRDQMAAFIMRALGEFSPPTPPVQRFNDVPSSNVFYNFIDRVAVLQITLGCSQSPPLYCPGDPVTRAQMAAFLVRAFKL